jgi:hypothetical protein
MMVISFGFTRLPLTGRELVTRTLKEFVADNGLGLAAQLAYYFFLFPVPRHPRRHRARELLPA